MTKRYRITVGNHVYDVEVGDIDETPIQVRVDDKQYTVEVPARFPQDAVEYRPNKKDEYSDNQAPPPRAAPVQTGSGNIVALMPGRVLSVEVSQGDSVNKGQTVCVIESMKMEQSIAAPMDGTVDMVHVAAGDAVKHGELLIALR